MGAKRPRPLALDAGAFIAFERNDRRVCALIELAVANDGELLTTGGVVGQVWRDGRRQARLARLLASERVSVQPIDREEGRAAGALCGSAGTRDVIDASLVLVARRSHAVVVTSDPADILALDPNIDLVTC